MDELLKGGQTLGVFAIFAILVIREVLSWLGKRQGREQGCNLRNGALHQLTSVYEHSIKAAASFEHLAQSVDRLSETIDRYNNSVNDVIKSSSVRRYS